jgi:murein DD-endopeptidase MepM/ murein hydrolase activator NlpD
VYSSTYFFKLYVTLGLVVCSGISLSFLSIQKPSNRQTIPVLKAEKLVETKSFAVLSEQYPKKSDAPVLDSINEKSSTIPQTLKVDLPESQPNTSDQSEKKLEKTQIKHTQVSPTPISLITAADVVEEPVRMPGIKMEDPAPATRMPGFESDTWKMPFKSGVVIQMHQGYNGQFSHQGKYALDFPHPDGIEILAARGGTVVSIANGGKWDGWCRSLKECNNKGQISAGNNITIQHSDGTKARYLHFRPGTISPDIRVGSQVKQGSFLGLMGSTGYTCLTPACTEPDNHLHFEVQTADGRSTIPTSFMECVNRANVCDNNGWFVQYNYYTSD